MKPHIQIIIGSTRVGRRGEMVGKWFMQECEKRSDATVEILDLRDFNLPMYGEAPREGEDRDAVLKRWSEAIARGDGYVYVMGEYNHSFPAVMKNAIDLLHGEWARKPASFVSYGGGGGGIRAVEQLRQVIIELQMASTRLAIMIPNVRDAFDENGTIRNPDYGRRAQDVLDELVWWTVALKNAREAAPAHG